MRQSSSGSIRTRQHAQQQQQQLAAGRRRRRSWLFVCRRCARRRTFASFLPPCFLLDPPPSPAAAGPSIPTSVEACWIRYMSASAWPWRAAIFQAGPGRYAQQQKKKPVKRTSQKPTKGSY